MNLYLVRYGETQANVIHGDIVIEFQEYLQQRNIN